MMWKGGTGGRLMEIRWGFPGEPDKVDEKRITGGAGEELDGSKARTLIREGYRLKSDWIRIVAAFQALFALGLSHHAGLPRFRV
jgi:hypothetical protein